VKARTVKGLDPDIALADAAERIIRTRVDELYSFEPAALDPAQSQALHDLRIAAKRLRYVLEVTAPCFGDYARTALRRTKALQDLVGDIHDCDVMLPRVLGEIERLRERDAEALLTLAGDDDDIDADLVLEAPNAALYRGLEVFAAYIEARRARLFSKFVDMWAELQREGFRARLEYAASERPEPDFAPLAPRLPAGGTPVPDGP
jgi:CHAD domain-containing protein